MQEVNCNLRITKVKYQGFSKEVYFNNGKMLTMGFSSCVDEENEIIQHGQRLYVKCENGKAQIYPSYFEQDIISVGDYSIEILVKEITDDKELKSYESLSQYHYKGQRLFGRSVILIATTTTPYLPKVLGYIELTTPFYVNKPRAQVFDATFKHNGIAWSRWDKETTKKYINTICRIARCVVYPEFRGVGLGQVLVSHGMNFAKKRWQISETKPLFVEISADMLKYVPFAESVGMHYIGDTQGNLDRIHKDLEYLLSNYQRIQDKEIVSEQQMGIVMQQKTRLKKAMQIIENNNLSIHQFLDKLSKLKDSKKLKDLQFFSGLLSLPKPTYLKGLDKISDDFIKSRINSFGKKSNNIYDNFVSLPLTENIVLQSLEINYITKAKNNEYTIAIQNAFNINAISETTSIIKDLSFEIKPGEIILVTGSSGSGKTTLLDYLALSEKINKRVTAGGSFVVPSNYKPISFKEIDDNRPLVELFGKKDLSFGLKLLGMVGLSDAYVYLKKYSELSKGQQFRASLAQAIMSGSNVLIIDEFCSNLDSVTANVVTYRLRKLVKKLGINLIIGAAHCDNFIHTLSPDKVLRLSTAWDYEVLTGSSYSSLFAKKRQKVNFQALEVSRKLFEMLLENQKCYLVIDKNTLKQGMIVITYQDKHITAYINDIQKVKASDLSMYKQDKMQYVLMERLNKDNNRYDKKLQDRHFVYILSLHLFGFSNKTNCNIKNISLNG